MGGRQFFIGAAVLWSAFALVGCGDATKPDVSGVAVTLETHRFDLDMYAIDTQHIGAGLAKLHDKYPDFLDYYLDTLMDCRINGNYTDSSRDVQERFRPYLTYKDFKNQQDTIRKYYPDISPINQQLTKGFKYVKHYLPGYKVPRIYYLNMQLTQWPTFPLDEQTLCIGLDMFLGPQYPYYTSVGIPSYMGTHLTREYLPVSVFATIYKAKYPFVSDERNLLDMIIQRGKEQYFLHHILPDASDELLFGFTPRQMEWCRQNEALIYNFFVQQGLLYATEPQRVMPYVVDGPFAKGLEATTATDKMTPGNIGAFMGYKVVQAYMQQHPKLTMQELLDFKVDPVAFLTKAKYKPK